MVITEAANTGQPHRWWAPVEPGQAARDNVDNPLAPIFWSRRREMQREAAAVAADLDWLRAQLPVARRADHGERQWQLAAARELSRRAAARGEPAAIHTAHRQAVLWAAVASEPALPAPWANDLLAAALWLGRRGAVELPSAANRRLAMALAAVACAFSGRPLHWVAASDDDAAAAAAAAAPIVAACGLRAAVVAHDAAPAAAAAGYRADIVFATLRRLAADLLRDRRVQAAGGDASARGAAGGSASGVGPLPLLTRGAHTALVDDIDRLLIDDATGPLVLSVADDSSGLADALVAARDLADLIRPLAANNNSNLAITSAGDADGNALTVEELRRLSEFKLYLPPMWRGAGRSETLVLQALHVRDNLQAGRDYFFAANGQLLFDEALADRLPDRAYMAAITQVLQARLRRPLSPVARTVERNSVITFFAGYRRLAGCASALDGLDCELRQHYRLHQVQSLRPPQTAPPRRPPASRPRCLGDAAAWAAAIDEIANLDTGAARLFIVRHQRDLAQLQPLLRPGQVAAALDMASASSALAGLVTPLAPGSAASPIEIVLTEPLDSARAELALLQRLHDAQIQLVDNQDAQGAVQAPNPPHPPHPPHSPPPPQVTRLAHPGARVLVESLPLTSSVGAALGRVWPAAARRLLPPLLPGLIRFARMLARRRARRQRVAVMLREQQLQQQLSFTGAPARRNLAPAPKDASTKKRG